MAEGIFVGRFTVGAESMIAMADQAVERSGMNRLASVVGVGA